MLFRSRRAAEIYGATFIEEEPVEIDRLSHELYPGIFNTNRRRLRKLQALALPLDEVVYVDVDVIVFRDFRPLFGRLEAGKQEFIVASPSFESGRNADIRLTNTMNSRLLRHGVCQLGWIAENSRGNNPSRDMLKNTRLCPSNITRITEVYPQMMANFTPDASQVKGVAAIATATGAALPLNAV